MDSLNLVSAFRGLILDHLLEMHTTLPATISSVDYGAKTATITALVKNTRTSTDEQDYPIFHDVPLFVLGGGNARITFPVTGGDVGVLVFSERDPSKALQSQGTDASSAEMIMPCGLYPIMFIPKIALGSDSTDAIDENNIVIDNNKSSALSLSPDGVIKASSKLGASITVDSGITITDGTGTLTISGGNLTWKGGAANINGLTISENGLLTDANGISLNGHTHVISNVQTGDSNITSETPTG